MGQVARRLSVLGLVGALPGLAWAAPAPEPAQDPRLTYQLHCEGCHMSDGSGWPGRVPALKGEVRRFLATPDGRAFLVRVPGVAQSTLDDRQLAQVLNWLVATFDDGPKAVGFRPYSPSEVRQLRAKPLSDTQRVRAAIVARLPARPAP